MWRAVLVGLLVCLAGGAAAQSNSSAGLSTNTAAEAQAETSSQSNVIVDGSDFFLDQSSSTPRAQNTKTTVKSVPDVAAPGLGPAGTHPCLIATSGAVGVTGLGLSLGAGRVDKGCEDRNTAALLANIGYKEAARAYLCEIDVQIKAAFQAIGQPCPHSDSEAPAVPDIVIWNQSQSARILKEREVPKPEMTEEEKRLQSDLLKAELLLQRWEREAKAKQISYVIE